jgi:hypothetical protein
MKKVLGPVPMSKFSWQRAAVAAGAAMVAAAGCKDRESVAPGASRGQPPPPAVTASAGACSAPGQPADASNVAELPQKTGAFCLDPAGSDRGYGEGAKNGIEGICDLFDGECAVYQKLGVKRVIEARWIDGGGSSATIDVKLSRFASPEQALAMFTKRAVGGGDPAHPDTPKPVEAGGLAALGIGNLYLWRGAELAEITYNDAEASTEQVTAKGNALLPALAKELGAKMPGATELPAAVKLLPAAGRLPMGLTFEPADALVPGGGRGAFGYYKDGDKRWRVLAIAGKDEGQAKDWYKVLAAKGSAGKKVGGADSTLLMVGEPKAEWIVARAGASIFGIGDEALVLRDGMSAEDHAQVCLPADAKQKRLAELLPK